MRDNREETFLHRTPWRRLCRLRFVTWFRWNVSDSSSASGKVINGTPPGGKWPFVNHQFVHQLIQIIPKPLFLSDYIILHIFYLRDLWLLIVRWPIWSSAISLFSEPKFTIDQSLDGNFASRELYRATSPHSQYLGIGLLAYDWRSRPTRDRHCFGREFLALRNVFKAAISPSFSPFQNPQKLSIVF